MPENIQVKLDGMQASFDPVNRRSIALDLDDDIDERDSQRRSYEAQIERFQRGVDLMRRSFMDVATKKHKMNFSAHGSDNESMEKESMVNL